MCVASGVWGEVVAVGADGGLRPAHSSLDTSSATATSHEPRGRGATFTLPATTRSFDHALRTDRCRCGRRDDTGAASPAGPPPP